MDQQDTQNNPGVTPEVNESHDNMDSLLEQEGLGIDFPQAGEIRKGVIASITKERILVSVGSKSEGVISGKELESIPPEELEKLSINQEINVYVINPEDSNGNVVLSFVRAQEEAGWQQAEALRDNKESFHSKIIGYNKGGLIVPIAGLRGFVPASQISMSRRAALSGETPDQRWSKMIGEDVDVVVIEVDRERRRLILSERAASTETRETLKERVIDELKEGETRIGRVTSLADFGAFVNISGADGLVHLSEISWDRIRHPSEVLKVGQEVKVKVISIDRDKKRIGLSLRAMQDDPWSNRVTQYQIGQLVQATITRLTKFGAFARLEDDLEGLIHISEISEKRIEHPKEVLKEGDTVTLRVIKIDPDNHRIGLSLRKVESMAYADMDFQSLEDIDETAPVAEGPEVLDPKLVEAKAKAEAKEAKEAKAKAKAKAEPKAEAETAVEAEPKAEAETVVVTEPKAEAEVVVDSEPKAEAEGEAKPKAKAKSKAKAEEAPEEKSE